LTKHLFLFSLSLSLCVASPLSLSLVFATTTEMIKDASSSSSSSSLFQISAKTLEEAFAQTSYLSYETVKQSTQRASVFAREKALRERAKRKEASERAKKELRERVLSVRERSCSENALCMRVTTDILNHHHRPRRRGALSSLYHQTA
jgi:hypothetical protein